MASHGASYSGGRQKQRTYNLEDTNIAGLGTDLEKAIRQAAAECEDQWKQAGKSAGIEVWRIEQFKVVPWPKKRYGEFFSGDSYIVLRTFHRKGKGALAWDAHFWIGDNSSQDEYGTAAYKTVELDDFLGGAATQYREVQGHESRSFKSLFKRIIITEGGVDSGFNHVKPMEYRARLLQCKGKLNVLVREVPIKFASFNSGDSFIFDDGLRIYVWHGKQAAIMEKAKAASFAQAIGDERPQSTRAVYEEALNDHDFWKNSGIKKTGEVKTAAEGGADDEVKVAQKRLMKVSDESGKLTMTELASGNTIRRSYLTSNDVFILDDGYEVMVWVGKGASRAERKTGLNIAAEYLKQYKRPLDTPITRIMDGGENELFEQAFEVGVASGKNIDDIRAQQRTGAAAGSTSAMYAGSGGPGVATDFDALYRQEGANPADWKGRTKAESAYGKEMQAGKHGAYSGKSGWVSGRSAEDRAKWDSHVAELEKQHAARGGKGAIGATLAPTDGFSASQDAEALRKAMKGLGTRNKVLISILARRTTYQRLTIRETYERQFKRNLIADIESETMANFERVLKALVWTPAERMADYCFKAMDGLGTDDTLLMEILCTREQAEIEEIKKAYERMFPDHKLETDIEGDTSGNYKEILLQIVNKGSPRRPSSEPIKPDLVKRDAEVLFKAGEKRWGHDSDKFIEIFTTRSFPQLKAIFEAYAPMSKRGGIVPAIHHEMRRNFKDALTMIAKFSLDPTEFYTERIHLAMKGIGTNDRSLINSMIERAEIDLADIAMRMPDHAAGKTLKDLVIGDTSGNYRHVLLAIIGEE